MAPFGSCLLCPLCFPALCAELSQISLIILYGYLLTYLNSIPSSSARAMLDSKAPGQGLWPLEATSFSGRQTSIQLLTVLGNRRRTYVERR